MLNPTEIRCESTEINPSEAPLDPDPCEPLPEDDVTEQVRPKRATLKKADEVGESGLRNLRRTIKCLLGL